MELISITSELMPKGAPNLTGVIKYPTIERLGQEVGKKAPLLMIFTIVRDFCDSINVVRNMNESQMMEVSSMLLDECGNFRMEDYVMMFSLAKRRQIGNIFDHVDIEVISKIMDDYWTMRHTAGVRKQEEDLTQYEEGLKGIARNPGKVEEGEVDLLPIITELANKMSQEEIRAKEDKQIEDKRRQDRIKRMQDVFWGGLTPEEQQDLQNQREKNSRYDQIKSFADMMAKGEKLNNPEDLQFYENNKKEIEDKLIYLLK